jgi:hypothetical protein
LIIALLGLFGLCGSRLCGNHFRRCNRATLQTLFSGLRSGNMTP